MPIGRLLDFLWTFGSCYFRARRHAPRHVPLDATIRRFLNERHLPRLWNVHGLYSPSDASVTRSAVRSFYRMGALHCFLGRQYADLMGLKPTDRQWAALTAIGTLAKIQDYLIDRLDAFPDDEQQRIYSDPDSYRPAHLAGALFRDTLLRMLALMPRGEFPHYHRVLDIIFQLQQESRRQQDPVTPVAEIKRLTILKGGYGIMAGLHVLNPHLSPGDAEYEALLSIGHWGQMVEDVLDEREDRREGTQTLVGRLPPQDLAREIIDRREKTLTLMGRLTHYSPARRAACLFRVFLPSVPAVARLQQLADGDDIYGALSPRHAVRLGRLGFDFLRRCHAQLRSFDPADYVSDQRHPVTETKDQAACLSN